jgi:hypothetical protein
MLTEYSPIKKNELKSTGDYIIVVFGDNGIGGDPFGFQRNFHLDVGPQSTTTVTPTVTYNVTTTPHESKQNRIFGREGHILTRLQQLLQLQRSL